MQIQVIFFFVLVTVGILLSGVLFPKKYPEGIAKKFGLPLILTGIAFAIWSIAIVSNLSSATLNNFITFGLGVLAIAQIINLKIGTTNFKHGPKVAIMSLGVLLAIAIFVLRIFYPSTPEIAPNGMIFFNPNEIVGFFEIIFIASGVLSSVIVVSNTIRQTSASAASALVSALSIILVGSVVLLTSTKVTLLTLDGWAIGIGVTLLLLVSCGVFGASKR